MMTGIVTENGGFSLMELLIVVCLIAVLGVFAGIYYTSWMARYGIEREMKEMYADIANARAGALMKNRYHFVSLAANRYTIYDDTNPSPDGNRTIETASDRMVRQNDTRYPLTWSGGARLDLTSRGMATADKTICSNADIRADGNCIAITQTRIVLGRLTTTIPGGGTCDDANCVPK